MSTDFQTARVALGLRLRELRTEAGLNGRQLAARLGWQASKISRLENGKQNPTAADLDAWSAAVGQPERATELRGRLRGLETLYRSWRRQLSAGHRPRQEAGITETQRTRLTRGFEACVIPGMFQTADYARSVLSRYAAFRTTPRDTEEAVNARIRRQDALYEQGREFRVLVWEGALYVRVCPREVLAAQLDRRVMTDAIRGADWLAHCSPTPDAVFAAWARDELARIPTGPYWAAVEADLLRSVRAMEPLSRADLLGPVLAHPETERAWWLVPPDAHSHLADLAQLTVHEKGWPLLCPSPEHGTQGMCWLERPDGTGKLTDPAGLGAAFGRGGRLPAEVWGRAWSAEGLRSRVAGREAARSGQAEQPAFLSLSRPTDVRW